MEKIRRNNLHFSIYIWNFWPYCNLRNSGYLNRQKCWLFMRVDCPPDPASSDRPEGYNVRQLKICTHIYNHKTLGLVRHLSSQYTPNFTYLNSAQSNLVLKFIYSEKATKFCKIFTLLLNYVVPVKSKIS